MQDCYAGMRAALARNIEGLTNLTEEQREGLLNSEMAAAMAATEAGRPFVDIYGPSTGEASDGPDFDEDVPMPHRVAPVKVLRP